MISRELQIELYRYNRGIEKARAAYDADCLVADGLCGACGWRPTEASNKRRCVSCRGQRKAAA